MAKVKQLTGYARLGQSNHQQIQNLWLEVELVGVLREYSVCLVFHTGEHESRNGTWLQHPSARVWIVSGVYQTHHPLNHVRVGLGAD